MGKIHIVSKRERFENDSLYIQPQLGNDIWLYLFHNDVIKSIKTGEIITSFNDDRGLYPRIREILSVDVRITLMAQGLIGLTFVCPSNTKQFYNSPFANKIFFYDGLEENKFLDCATFRAKMFTYIERKYHERILIPVVCNVSQIDSLFVGEESILRTNKEYLGFVGRSLNDDLTYLLEDPYANIHEPKYITEIELTEIAPDYDRIEDLIEHAIQTINWELLKTQIPYRDDGKYQWVTSILMDQFYFDVLYYSISKKLWLSDRKADQILQGVDEESVIVDFSQIKKLLRAAIRVRLGSEGSNKLSITHEDPKDDDDDLSWIFKDEE